MVRCVRSDPNAFEQALAARRWDREQAAEELGVSSRTVYRWAAGKAQPQGKHLRRVYEKLPELKPASPDSVEQLAQQHRVYARRLEDLESTVRFLLRQLGEAGEKGAEAESHIRGSAEI